MARTIKRYHIGLDFKDLTDANRLDLMTAIKTIAPSSDIFGNTPPIQTSVNALVTKGGALQQGNNLVTNDRQKLKADTDAAATLRTAFDGELRTLKLLTETGAKTAADLTAMGFPPPPPAPPKGPPMPPDSIDVKTPKTGHGKLVVSAHELPGLKRHYVVESSPGPGAPTTWTILVGTGKSRTVTGASAAQIWVRYATVRGQVQSDWGTPVLVTIP